MSNLQIYTDGAYSSARDQGGIGVVFVKDGIEIQSFSKMFPHVTNNKMELIAVIIALQTILKNNIRDEITIVTDSQYVIGCATKGWKRKKNIKLWNKYDKVKEQLDLLGIEFQYTWVHGHDGNKFNERADVLAVTASQEINLN